MGFRQKVNARNVTQRTRKFHRTPAASSFLDLLTQQVKQNITLQRTRSPHLPQAPVTSPSIAGTTWDEREEQLLLSMHQAGKSSKEMSDQLPRRSQRVCQRMKAQGRRPRISSPAMWVDRQDEIVISDRKAGKTLKEAGKLRSSRTVGAVKTRGTHCLKDDPRESVDTHRRKQRNWSEREEELLLSLRAGGKAWDKISKTLRGRGIEACKKRYVCIRHRNGHQESCNGSSWTKAEVKDLIFLVKKNGRKWSKIAKSFPGRSPEACKIRHDKGVPAKHRNKPWTDLEEMTLLSLLIALGRRWRRWRRWKKISKEIPSRTQDACRIYYDSYKKLHDGKLPEACGPSPEQWRQKWGKESIIHRLQNEHSRTTLTTIDIPAAEDAQTNPTQADATTQTTNEAVNSDTTTFSYPVLNTVSTLGKRRMPSGVDARKRRVMDVRKV